MDRILIRKYISQSVVLFTGLAIALFAFTWVRVWAVTLFEMQQFEKLFEQFKMFEKFFPVEVSELLNYPGQVGLTFDEIVVIICVMVWCIARGSDVVSGELNRGTLEMILAQPISRMRLLISHATVSVTGLALLCLVIWAGLAVGIEMSTVKETLPPDSLRIPILNLDIPISTADPVVQHVPMSSKVNVATYAASVFHLFCLGFFVLSMSTFFSCIDRYRWRAIGIVMTIYVSQFAVFLLGKVDDSLGWLHGFSFFSCYKPQKMTALVRSGDLWSPWSLTQSVPDATFPPLIYPMILLAMGLTLFGLAAWCFHRRDLPAPL